ncbi:aspartate kinase [Olsenella sp. HMSC062G07]|uniref:aspartate kinase n=1 Tax=Olsenella sp. HMSC062G07 TaxID=1739330 RepID=UPI0008A5D617|nr:aspartate kinase [Olsenella sp. HMSC062G07]OFK23994.1 aspartate kinase [Olsenella sp. HMSC062G07]
MIKVAKFGGSSVADAEQFKKVKGIVDADPDRRFVVVSASGRRFAQDNKVTDLLLLVNAHIEYHVDCTALLHEIEQRYVDIKEALGLSFPVRERFDDFIDAIHAHSPEFVVSRGEWFTAQLMAEYLEKPFLDARDVIVFHHDGTVDLERTQLRIRDAVQRLGDFVMPGFYGSTVDGSIKLFQRGGGDISGAILARCIDANLYENWTDVSGFLSADPRVVDDPRTIHRITFDEMRELSYMGASVLQEDSIFPVREVGIPIQIKNTNLPEKRGTTISEVAKDGAREHLITGIAGKKDFLAVHVQKAHMSSRVGFVRRALSVFERYGVSVEHIPTGVDSFGVVVSAADVKDNIYAIVHDLQKELEPDSINVVDQLALISVVGRNMSRRAGTSGRVFGVLGEAGINIRMITQSSQEISIIMGVSNADFERAIRCIYDNFVDTEMVDMPRQATLA